MRTLSIVFSLAALSACASSPGEPATAASLGNDCVYMSFLRDWQYLDERSMVLWSPNADDAYLLVLSTPLFNLKFEHTLGFVDADNDRRLCSFGRDSIVAGNRSTREQATIMSMKRLDAAGIAQLEAKYKVKLTRESRGKALPKQPDREAAQ